MLEAMQPYRLCQGIWRIFIVVAGSFAQPEFHGQDLLLEAWVITIIEGWNFDEILADEFARPKFLFINEGSDIDGIRQKSLLMTRMYGPTVCCKN